MLTSVYLVAEDVLGLAVGRKLVAEHPILTIHCEENGRGYGKLRAKANSYNMMAKNGFPVLLLTDLDNDSCPSIKIKKWLGRQPNLGFLLRICVREVEAWLLADREAMASYLKVKLASLPIAPESLADPKAKLIELAQNAPRRIRVALTPIGSATVGPDYNEYLAEYILRSWSIDRAMPRSPSLARARNRIAELAGIIAVAEASISVHQGQLLKHK